MALEEAQNKFLQIMREIKSEEERDNFLKWIHSNWNVDVLMDQDATCQDTLYSIAEELRSMVPFEAILDSEKISLPLCGPNSDCKSQSTIHVDEFLYDDEYVDNLVEEGKMSKYYCEDCCSKNVKLLTYISHSMSINRIQYIFNSLLPPLKKETILDVGSRLGPVLYGAYLYTASSKIIGIELNPDFCKLQSTIVEKYRFSDRIQIICNSVFNELEVLSSADVIILNNVFEFFADLETTITSWCLLAQNIKSGCLLVTIPHLEETFKSIKVPFNWKDWVEELQPYQQDNLNCDVDLESHLKNVKHYRVKKKMNILSKS